MLVAGATGALGRLAVADLLERGALVALAGRDTEALAELAAAAHAPARTVDAYDLDACAGSAPWARAALGGLDGVLVTVGVAGFGPAAEVADATAEHLMTVNALCPMALLRGAVPVVGDGGFLAAVTGAIVDSPLLGTADYTASKAALAGWLGVLRRETRPRHLTVVDARLPHLDTGFASRAVAGTAPPLAAGADPAPVVHALVEQLVSALARSLPPGNAIPGTGLPTPSDPVH